MSEETSKKNILDIATFITVGGIILYQMGWIYWTKYFSALNIDPSFIEMPIEKFIATTWHISLVILVSFLIGTMNTLDRRNNNLDIGVAIVSVAIALLSVFGKYMDSTIFIISIGSSVLSLIIYLFVIIKFNLTPKSINKKNFFYFLVTLMYILGFIVYSEKGKSDAKKLIQDFKNPDVEIICNDKSHAKGKFISFMNGKYFILLKDRKGKNQTFILNDSEVHHVKFIK